MNKLADEQIKEFWEWCGFEWFEAMGVWRDYWLYPDDKRIHEHFNLPRIDLNNLFEYAAPKLKAEVIKFVPFSNGGYGCVLTPKGWKNDISTLEETPALALFWAIYGAMK